MANNDLRRRLLDARPDRLDLRDRKFVPRVASLPERFPDTRWAAQIADYVRAGHVLDQGSEGACTGFGLAAVVNYLYWRATGRTTIVSPRMLYHLAQFYDEWRGEDYTGSSCRGALKGWHKHGVCLRKFWPYTVDAQGTAPHFEAPLPGWETDAPRHRVGVYYRVDTQSIVDMQAAIAEIGAVYVSGEVHDGWDAIAQARGPDPKRARGFKLDRIPVIAPRRTDDVGGHAYALVGYTPVGFIVQNSWGTRWGHYGFGILPYADWLATGTDAWVCALGVPAAQTGAAERAARHFVRSQTPRGEALNGPAGAAGAPPAPRKTLDPQVYFEPLSVGAAYERTLVLGAEGQPEQRLVAVADAAASAWQVCFERPRLRLRSSRTGTPKLVVYALGGLDDEADTLDRVRVLAPYFEANGCVPVFITWRTGLLDTVVDLIRERLDAFLGVALPQQGYWEDLRRGLRPDRDALTDRTDRAIEVGLRSAGGKALWTELKDNAAGGARPGGGLQVLADALARLADRGGEIHLIGHSAGAIVQGHLLRLLAERALPVASCHLLAPACTVEFALAHYAAACGAGQLARERLHVHALSQAHEDADQVGGVYRRSLLSLVSRALESVHKTPVLGLLKCFDPACNTPEHWNADGARSDADSPSLRLVREWQRFFWADGAVPKDLGAGGAMDAGRLHVVATADGDRGPHTGASAHGRLDTDAPTLRAILASILDAQPKPEHRPWHLRD